MWCSDDVVHRFEDFGYQVSAVARQEAVAVFGLLAYKAINVASYSLDRNVEWPFLTMPHFEERGNTNNRFSRALQMSLVALVSKEKKAMWEDYAWTNQQWVQEGVNSSSDLHVDFLGPDLKVPEITRSVYRFVGENSTSGDTVPEDGSGGVDFGPGAYGVVWQQAPAPHDPSIINFNLLSHPVFARVYRTMWESSQAVLSEVLNLGFLYEGAVRDEITNPHSFLMQPIYPSLANGNEKIDRDSLLGFIVGVLPWDTYFLNLLPGHIKGIIVVLHNSCGEDFTYRLDGQDATYLGEGDLHDTKYNHLEITSPFAPTVSVEDSSTSLDKCDYDLRIYPSPSFEDGYRTSRPLFYAVVVLCLFVFTAGKNIYKPALKPK